MREPQLTEPVTDVYPLLGGGFRATCDCGCTEATPSEQEGWLWVLDHPCGVPTLA
jgi:hypothetical protein